MTMSKTGAKLLLAAVFIARGTSFLCSKTLLQDMSPSGIMAVRFLLAFLVLAIIFHRKLFGCRKQELTGGIILGAMYTVCMLFEMYGLRLIDSGVSSLIENMAIILVPLYAAILSRTLPKKKTILCAILAMAGVGFLSITQRETTGGTLGILLVLGAALTYAACILVTERVSQDADPLSIGMVQLGTMGALNLLLSCVTGEFGVPQTGAQWGFMLLLVLVCSCFGFAFQPVGQKYLPAETAAVFTVVNPLTASVMGIVIAREVLNLPKIAGYNLVLAALVIYNLPKKEIKNTGGIS